MNNYIDTYEKIIEANTRLANKLTGDVDAQSDLLLLSNSLLALTKGIQSVNEEKQQLLNQQQSQSPDEYDESYIDVSGMIKFPFNFRVGEQAIVGMKPTRITANGLIIPEITEFAFGLEISETDDMTPQVVLRSVCKGLCAIEGADYFGPYTLIFEQLITNPADKFLNNDANYLAIPFTGIEIFTPSNIDLDNSELAVFLVELSKRGNYFG
ncbi:hypothetical protein Lepto7375DRAFT_7235 [Leptolyngbya sp. PCC 7375]|nr:hypothetical protein Lepto7375DRAFT_7235 [Leptolyngbya sp. PCC 7375]